MLAAGTQPGPYKILARLGSGGMGEVYRAHDERLGRDVALKFLPEGALQDPSAVERFIREAQAASALNHPNIVTIYEIGETEAGRFIAMEFIQGRTLRALTGQPLSLDRLAHLGTQMARALVVTHAARIIHRDIKPENIMVRDDGYVKVLDFGLARLLPTSLARAEAETMSGTTPGTLLGTLRYMSPEQARGETVESATDIGAAGRDEPGPVVAAARPAGGGPRAARRSLWLFHRRL